MIPFPGKLTVKRWAAEDQARAAEEKYHAKTQEIIARVKSAYYALSFVDRSIQINQENESLLKNFARIAEAKYMVGKATQHDVLKAQIELSLLADKLITLRQKKRTSQAKLNVLLDRAPATPIKIPTELTVPQLTASEAELEKLALANRPQLVAMEHALNASDKMHLLAKMGYLPNFKLGVVQREMSSSGLNGWNVNMMASVPLWFWKQGFAVSEAGSKREAAKAAYDNLENMVRFEVWDAYERVDSDRRLTELYKEKIIPQAEQALRSATTAYEAEKVEFLTLINSQKTLEESRLRYYQALSDQGRSLADLERIVGGINNE
jgi:outer membrane protein TolC